MIENLTATNSRGLSITFDNSLRVTKGLDLSGLTAEVNTTETTGAGSKYQNTRLTNRSIDLEFQIRRQLQSEGVMDDKRANLYKVFTPESNPIRFDFNLTDGVAYYFTAYMTSSPILPPNKTDNNSAFQLGLIQMISSDPYIYRTIDSSVDIATIEDGFEFVLEIPEGVGIEFGNRTESLIANIPNDSTGDVGFVVTFSSDNTVVNPLIENIQTYERIQLNTTMLPGDEITVDTTKGKRSIIRTRDNVKENIFNTLDFLNSSFFQLHPGDNLIRYGAQSGEDRLNVQINHNIRYVGV